VDEDDDSEDYLT